jgi:hypothetical protein
MLDNTEVSDRFCSNHDKIQDNSVRPPMDESQSVYSEGQTVSRRSNSNIN